MERKTEITKIELVDVIYSKLNGIIPKTKIRDAIRIICDDFEAALVIKEDINIKNFGTLHIYTMPSHKAVDIKSNEQFITKEFFNVKFIPHENFMTVFNFKKDRFKK